MFAGLKDELSNPIAITEYIKAYNDERRRLARKAGDQMSKLTRRNAEVSRELERLIDAVTQGVDLVTLVPGIKALEIERTDIDGKLKCASGADIVTLHPAAIEQYRADVKRLAALAAEHSDFAESAELIEAVRRLVAGVIIHAEPYGRGFNVEVQGRPAQLTNSDLFPSRSEGWGISGSGRPLHRITHHRSGAIYLPAACSLIHHGQVFPSRPGPRETCAGSKIGEAIHPIERAAANNLNAGSSGGESLVSNFEFQYIDQ